MMPKMIGLAQEVEGNDYVRVLKWLKSENSFVSAGDILVLVSEGKSNIIEIRSEQACTLAKILIPEGPDHLLGREVIGVLTFDDDSEQSLRGCINMGEYINDLLDGLDFTEDEDEESEPDNEQAADDERESYTENEPVIDRPVRSTQSSRPKGFLAGLFGAAAGSAVTRSVAGNNQPRIGVVINRGHGTFEVFDENNRRIAQILRHGAELKGYTSTQFHLQQSGRLYTFNARGQCISERTV